MCIRDSRSGEESDGVTAVADAVKRSGEEGAPIQAEELRAGGDDWHDAPAELTHTAVDGGAGGDGWPLECDAPPELSHIAADGALSLLSIWTPVGPCGVAHGSRTAEMR